MLPLFFVSFRIVLRFALFIIAITAFCGTITYLFWRCKIKKQCTSMSFFQWKKLYKINPEKWHIGKSDSYYNDEDLNRLWYRHSPNSHMIQIRFGLFSYWCWLIWRFFNFLKINKQRNDEYLIEVLEDCQEDINKLKQKSKLEIESALEEQKRVFGKWKF